MSSTTFKRPRLSIVVPAFNEADCLPTLIDEVRRVCTGLGTDFEMIVVDDGSTDGTWNVITHLADKHGNLRGVRLARNFGHQQALLAGLQMARGDAVITMDADLQHPPDLIADMVGLWTDGAQIVSTKRSDSRRPGIFKKVTAHTFYRLFSALSGVHMDHGKADYRLLAREVVDIIVSLPETNLFLRGIVEWTGIPQKVVVYTPGERHAGRSKYSLRKMLGLALTGITSFSVVPLRLGLVIGMITTVLSLGYGIFAVVAALSGHVVKGWTSLVCLFSFLFGIQFLITGVLSEYLAQTFLEVKRRPRFIVDSSVQDVQRRSDTRSTGHRSPDADV